MLGAAAAGAMLGLRDVYEGPPKEDDIVIVSEAPGDPEDIDIDGITGRVADVDFWAPPPGDPRLLTVRSSDTERDVCSAGVGARLIQEAAVPAARGEDHRTRLVLEHPAGEVPAAPRATCRNDPDRSACTPRGRRAPTRVPSTSRWSANRWCSTSAR